MSAKQFTARAGANIALVKYWGKRSARLNLPAAGSLSITLADLETRTTVIPERGLRSDELVLDGRSADAGRAGEVLDLLREQAGSRKFCRIESHNNFPTAAGLASSASGFAALVVAAAAAFELELPASRLSELARRGSGSAARSIFGGFVEMNAGVQDDGSDAVAQPLKEPAHWPLEVVAAITDAGSKAVDSRSGMNHTMDTSPYYPAWIKGVAADVDAARAAVEARDFEALADVSEYSALKMHASMLAARPGLLYWNAGTMACMHAIRELRASGTGVFFTMDAGPQVKAVCLPGEGRQVADALRMIAGVHDVLFSQLGPGAALVGKQ